MDRDLIFDILGAVQRIDQVTVAEVIVAELCACLQRYGFTAGLITRLPVPHDKHWFEQIIVNRWPRSWYEHYNAQGHYRHDPCAERSRRTVDPFFWSELTNQPLGRRSDVVMHEAAEFGLRQGLCVPIHSPFASPSVVTVSGEFIKLPPATVPVVQTLALHAFRAIQRSQNGKHDPGAPILSGREREILQWTSAGKTAWEISCILDISLHTVNTHLKNVRYKLGAANRTHSVVEALRRNEIQL
jgi:LuxR family quorum sensing-dependent transcriptional regulator